MSSTPNDNYFKVKSDDFLIDFIYNKRQKEQHKAPITLKKSINLKMNQAM